MVRRPQRPGIAVWLVILAGCTTRSTPPVAPPSEVRAKPVAAQPDAVVSQPVEVEAPEAPVAPRPRLRVEPESISLSPDDPGVQLLVSREGSRADLTGSAPWVVEPEGVVSVSESGYVRPVSAGEASLRFRQGDEEVEVPVSVADRSERAWDFAEDVVPLFTRYGCNTGGCHGKAAGQNGFHLSLFGYDPEGDYLAISRDAAGRRIDRMDPESSLLLQKATGLVSHGGGLRFSGSVGRVPDSAGLD